MNSSTKQCLKENGADLVDLYFEIMVKIYNKDTFNDADKLIFKEKYKQCLSIINKYSFKKTFCFCSLIDEDVLFECIDYKNKQITKIENLNINFDQKVSLKLL